MVKFNLMILNSFRQNGYNSIRKVVYETCLCLITGDESFFFNLLCNGQDLCSFPDWWYRMSVQAWIAVLSLHIKSGLVQLFQLIAQRTPEDIVHVMMGQYCVVMHI